MTTALQHLRALIDDLDAVVWESDPSTGRFTFVGGRAEDLLGLSPKRLVQEPDLWSERLHPDDRDRGLRAHTAEAPDAQPHDLEIRFLHPDGRTLWLRDVGHAVVDDGDRAVAVRGLLVDVTERTLAEARRAEVEQRYRDLVEQLPGVVYLETVEGEAEPGRGLLGRCLYVSPQIERLLGFRAEEWVSDPVFWTTRIHPEDIEAVRAAHVRALTADEPYRADFRLLAKDGRVVWVHDEAVLARDPEGIALYWQGARFDISQQRLADERAAASEQRFQILVEGMPAVVYTASAEPDEPRIVYVSPQIEAILGVEPEAWLGEAERRLKQIHPDDRERARAASDRASATGEPLVAEYRVRASDGRWVWVRDQAVLVRDAEDRPLLWQGVMLDISDRVQAEEQLRDAEERYRALVEQTPVVTYIDAIAPSDATLYVSPQVVSLLGYQQEALTSLPPLWPSLIHPEDRERVLAHAAEAERREAPYSVEYRMCTKDGRTIWVLDQSVLIRDEQGRPLYWQGVWMDITERQRATELERALELERRESAELRELDRMKNTFLQAVSHDLRTPLAAILGLAITLGREDVAMDGAEAKDLAARIATNARKLDRLVSDLLDLDRLSRGIVEPNLARLDLGALVGSLVRGADLVQDRTVIVRCDEAWIDADAAKIERIVENLLMNAVRHTPEGTSIWVSVTADEGGAVIAVEDEGPGVPPELRQEIFQPFRRGPAAPEHGPGVGVGLALVARFAELHGGRAWVQGREGGGASFRVWLPAGGGVEPTT